MPVYLAARIGRPASSTLPVSTVTPARSCTGISARLMMLAKLSTLPLVLGKARFSSPFGQPTFHSRNVLTTIGGSGTSRLPASDFGEPIALKRSAR